MIEVADIKQAHNSDTGKKWLYWISLAAVSLTVVSYLRKL